MSDPQIKIAAEKPKPVKRGRKEGYRKYRRDKNLLFEAARLVNSGHSKSVREALLKLTNRDETDLRRLQRQWKKDGASILEQDRKYFIRVCEHEYAMLRKERPALWAMVAEFVATNQGKEYLKKFKGEHAPKDYIPHPMAIGLAHLRDGIEQYFATKKSSKQLDQPTVLKERNASRFF